MHSMIISVIAIALVAVLSVATIMYGGSVFTIADEGAKAAEILNHAQQIAAATEAYIVVTEGLRASTIDDLVGPGLSRIPETAAASGNYAINMTQVTLDGVNEPVCELIADKQAAYFGCQSGNFFFNYR
jgi:fatty acid-binding protein DegV